MINDPGRPWMRNRSIKEGVQVSCRVLECNRPMTRCSGARSFLGSRPVKDGAAYSTYLWTNISKRSVYNGGARSFRKQNTVQDDGIRSWSSPGGKRTGCKWQKAAPSSNNGLFAEAPERGYSIPPGGEWGSSRLGFHITQSAGRHEMEILLPFSLTQNLHC